MPVTLRPGRSRAARNAVERLGRGNAELVVGGAGGDLGVGAGLDIGIDAEARPARRRPVATATADRVRASSTDSRLNWQQAAGERLGHFVGGLADARKEDRSGGMPAARARAIFADRDDVGAQPLARQRRQHRRVGVGLDRIGDQRVVERGQRLAQHARMADQRRGRIDIDRRADFVGDVVERDLLAVQAAVAEVKMIHAVRTLSARIGTEKFARLRRDRRSPDCRPAADERRTAQPASRRQQRSGQRAELGRFDQLRDRREGERADEQAHREADPAQQRRAVDLAPARPARASAPARLRPPARSRRRCRPACRGTGRAGWPAAAGSASAPARRSAPRPPRRSRTAARSPNITQGGCACSSRLSGERSSPAPERDGQRGEHAGDGRVDPARQHQQPQQAEAGQERPQPAHAELSHRAPSPPVSASAAASATPVRGRRCRRAR